MHPAVAAFNRHCGVTFAADSHHRCTSNCSFWEWKDGAPELTFVCKGVAPLDACAAAIPVNAFAHSEPAGA